MINNSSIFPGYRMKTKVKSTVNNETIMGDK